MRRKSIIYRSASGFCAIFFSFFLAAGFSFAADSTENPLPAAGFVEGWVMEGKVSTYNPENLYTHINGEAELYLPYGFQVAWSAVYVRKDDPTTGLAVDVYKMRSLLDGFGIYSNYRSPDTEEVAIGSEGFASESQLIFYKERYFVQLSASGSNVPEMSVFTAFAKGIAGKLPGSSTSPGELAFLKVSGVIPRTEKYFAQSVLGYGFFKKGFTAAGTLGGASMKVFVVMGESGENAALALESYVRYLKEAGVTPVIRKDTDGAVVSAQDPLYKGVLIRQAGPYLVGAASLKDPATAMALIDQLKARVK
jgi:hypothetical protein